MSEPTTTGQVADLRTRAARQSNGIAALELRVAALELELSTLLAAMGGTSPARSAQPAEAAGAFGPIDPEKLARFLASLAPAPAP